MKRLSRGFQSGAPRPRRYRPMSFDGPLVYKCTSKLRISGDIFKWGRPDTKVSTLGCFQRATLDIVSYCNSRSKLPIFGLSPFLLFTHKWAICELTPISRHRNLNSSSS